MLQLYAKLSSREWPMLNELIKGVRPHRSRRGAGSMIYLVFHPGAVSFGLLH